MRLLLYNMTLMIIIIQMHAQQQKMSPFARCTRKRYSICSHFSFSLRFMVDFCGAGTENRCYGPLNGFTDKWLMIGLICYAFLNAYSKKYMAICCRTCSTLRPIKKIELLTVRVGRSVTLSSIMFGNKWQKVKYIIMTISLIKIELFTRILVKTVYHEEKKTKTNTDCG